ncbi:hypothetical protein O9929_14880 [Vibrio lentus]|nr:hypothetical protein [Vibrio lentus]
MLTRTRSMPISNETDTSINIGKKYLRILKLFFGRARQALHAENALRFSARFRQQLWRALLADSYLKLIGFRRYFPAREYPTRIGLCFINITSEINSPELGVANMTLADGSPHETFPGTRCVDWCSV